MSFTPKSTPNQKYSKFWPEKPDTLQDFDRFVINAVKEQEIIFYDTIGNSGGKNMVVVIIVVRLYRQIF